MTGKRKRSVVLERPSSKTKRIKRFYTDERGRRRPIVESVGGRPPRRPTTMVYGVAKFNGEEYLVYGRRGGAEERVIFPKSEAFSKAPFGTTFEVEYKGRKYKAVKRARIIPGRGPVPILEWITQ